MLHNKHSLQRLESSFCELWESKSKVTSTKAKARPRESKFKHGFRAWELGPSSLIWNLDFGLWTFRA
jgi:hypothetical protein